MTNLCTDTFTRTDAATLGASYTVVKHASAAANPFGIVSNQASYNSGYWAFVYRNDIGTVADVKVTATIVSDSFVATGRCGVAACVPAATDPYVTGYLFAHYNGSFKLYRNGGQVGSTYTATLNANDVLSLEVNAGVMVCRINGTTRITYTDASPLAAGYCGLQCETNVLSATAVFDDFAVDSFVAQAPNPPTDLAATLLGAALPQITWTASSVDGTHDAAIAYKVYGADTPGFTPGPGNLLATLGAVALYSYVAMTAATHYYRVAAYNSGGETLATTEVSVASTATISAWRAALDAAYAQWGCLSPQLTSNGLYWGISSRGHDAWSAPRLFQSPDGINWTSASLNFAPFDALPTGWGATTMHCGVTANGVCVFWIRASTGCFIARNTNNLAVDAWVISAKVWDSSGSTHPNRTGSGGLVHVAGRGDAIVLYGDENGATAAPGNGGSYKNSLLFSDDDFATWSEQVVVDPTATVYDPDVAGNITLRNAFCTEMAVAAHTDGLLLVAHCRHDAYGYSDAAVKLPTAWQDGTDATDYAQGLVQLLSADGGATWHYSGRPRDAAGSIIPNRWVDGGSMFYLADRFYTLIADRYGSYTNNGGTSYTAAEVHLEKMWLYSADASDLRAEAGGGTTAKWRLDCYVTRPWGNRHYPYLGMMTFTQKAATGQYLVAGVEGNPNSGQEYAEVWVLDLSFTTSVAAGSGHAPAITMGFLAHGSLGFNAFMYTPFLRRT